MSPEERVKALLDAPPDTWIALAEDESRVVAHGAAYAEAVAKAEAAGVSDPVLIKVPDDWLERVYTFCA